MKITTWFHPKPQEIEVEVTAEDIVRVLSEEADTLAATINLINKAAYVLKAIPPEAICGMNDAQCRIIGNFLRGQADERFSRP